MSTPPPPTAPASAAASTVLFVDIQPRGLLALSLTDGSFIELWITVTGNDMCVDATRYTPAYEPLRHVSTSIPPGDRKPEWERSHGGIRSAAMTDPTHFTTLAIHLFNLDNQKPATGASNVYPLKAQKPQSTHAPGALTKAS